jgi:hypothetical protein
MRIWRSISAIVFVFVFGGSMSEATAEEERLPAAEAVLFALRDSLGDQKALVDAFGALYPETHLLEQGTDQIVLDLWANGQPYASVFMFQTTSPKSTTAIFSYWDPDILVTPFAAEAAKWVEIEVGPLTEQPSAPDLPVTIASSGELSVTLSRVASGEESQFDISFSRSD